MTKYESDPALVGTTSDSAPAVWAIDFETYYDNDYSLRTMPTWNYVQDPRFDCYLATACKVGDPDSLFVGPPSLFDWRTLDGAVILAHNMGFDGLVLRRLIADGIIPDFHRAAEYCTADLAAYCQLPRALKQIAKAVFFMPNLEKEGAEAREKMKGLSGAELAADEQIKRYAGNDALLCARVWEEYSGEWPEEEREVSRITRETGWRGVYVDMNYVQACCTTLQKKLFDASNTIPWDWSGAKTPLSPKKIREYAKDMIVEYEEEIFCPVTGKVTGTHTLVGPMPLPSSFSKDSEECQAWEDKWAESFSWVQGIRDWRRINTHLQRFIHIRDYTDDDHIYHHQLKYCGASATGRWSGGGGFNMQNMPRDTLFDCDLRRCFTARPGYTLVISDYAQIEPRFLLYSCKQYKVLDKIRGGMSVYQAHAEETTGKSWKNLKKEDPYLYACKKMEVLLLGYQGGWQKLQSAAYLMTKHEKDPVQFSDEEAQRIVAEYRAKNPALTYLWKAADNGLAGWATINAGIQRNKTSEQKVQSMKIPLLSGRSLNMWHPEKKHHPKTSRNYWAVMLEKNVPNSYRAMYGGKIIQNMNQANCRDVMASAVLNIDRLKDTDPIYLLWTTHDESICEVKDDEKKSDYVELINKAMTDLPEWAKDVPIEVETEVTPFYKK